MKCANCGLYHPAFYERCVGCGASLKESQPTKRTDIPKQFDFDDTKRSINNVRFGHVKTKDDLADNSIDLHQKANRTSGKSKLRPIFTKMGLVAAALILFISAGAVTFFLSQSSGDKHIVELGRRQLSLGQYAFAVETLNKAVAMNPNDPQVFLALARAYLGIDQVDKAWDCIVHAQQLGVGVVADPALTSQLANYYRQKGQYEKAIDLLRPLANAALPGKKAELADMEAFRGDECIEKGDLDQAKRSWEEVREIHEGSRFAEADARLATIYTRLADLAYSNHEDDKALDYLERLNTIGENSKNYLLAADIYERDGKLNEAIEQLRKCIKISAYNPYVQNRLADLLTKRGKELIASGDEQAGNEYLAQAKTADPGIKLPVVTLKNTTCKIDIQNKKPTIYGEVWNQSEKSLGELSMHIDLCDLTNEKILWSKSEHMIDEFMSPLAAKDTKPFNFVASYLPKTDENLAFKIYLNGNFYQTYPLKPGSIALKHETVEKPVTEEPSSILQTKQEELRSLKSKKTAQPLEADKETKETVVPIDSASTNSQPKESAEEKTLKDLDY